MGTITVTMHTPYDPTTQATDFALPVAEAAMAYHKSFAEYEPTPLADLSALAQKLGVGGIFVKDESYRFGLNAFKALGGSYAIGTELAHRLGKKIEEVTPEMLASPQVHAQLGDLHFVTATDGNHGRGIAWTARKLGYGADVFMPKGTSPRRVAHIEKLGGHVEVTPWNFDDTARHARQVAQEKGWVLTQDTTFPGYYDFPKWCMQGYTTMALEAYNELQRLGKKPTHIFIQAGAGSLAGAVVGFFASMYPGAEKPFIVVAESAQCDCLRRTAEANDGQLHKAAGDLQTIMAGLSVGEACEVGWKILDRYADAFVACDDTIAATGMRLLGAPYGQDRRVISGESGALGFGLAAALLRGDQYAETRKAFGLDENSVILCFSTEGDTDPENYQRIVWDGAWAGQ